MKVPTGQASCSIVLPGGAPEWVHLLPTGSIKGRDGRKWTLKNPQAVIDASIARGLDAVVDYEHQTDHSKENGQKAPAAGWIKEFQVRPGGIWGRIDWTARAAEHLEAKEYRYISPTFVFDKKTREILSILRAGLTNAPALHLTALATEQDEDSMEELLKALAAALGLPEDTTQEAALAKVGDLVKAAGTTGETIAAICKALKLKEGADADEIAEAIAKAGEQSGDSGDEEPDPSKYVPLAEYQKATARISVLEENQGESSAREAVTKAMREGKVAPSQKDWALGFAKKNLADFEAFLKSQPVIVKPTSEMPNGKPPRSGGELTEEEKAVCQQTGVSEDDFKKTREMEVAQ